MTTAFWLCATVVLYTYAGYPLLIALLARLRPHPWLQTPQTPSVSVIMAVHNGEAMLPWKLDHLHALPATLVREIVVVSDGSTDATADLLRMAAKTQANSREMRSKPSNLLGTADGDSHCRLRAIVLREQVGKAAALNHAIAVATGEILLFIDIRPAIGEGALEHLLSNFADPAVGCVAGELVLRSTAAQDGTASAVSGLYWRYEQWIRHCEAAFDSPVGVYGGFYAVRRSACSLLPAGLILDDMLQPLSVIRQGFRSVVDRRAIVTDTWPAKTAHEFQRKVRTLAGNFQMCVEAPWVLGPSNRVLFQLVSHKLLRLLVPYALLGMVGTAAMLAAISAAPVSIIWATVAGLQLLVWGAALLALRVRVPVLHRWLSPLSALLVLNAAAVAGLVRVLFTAGPLWKTWSPTAALPIEALTLTNHKGGA